MPTAAPLTRIFPNSVTWTVEKAVQHVKQPEIRDTREKVSDSIGYADERAAWHEKGHTDVCMT